MDPELEFRTTAVQTAAKLAQRGVAPTSIDGHTGWPVDHRHKQSTRGNPGVRGGWFEEYTETATLLLKPDGTFVEVGSWWTEGSDGDSPVTTFAYNQGSSHFVGTSMRPFEQWIEKLQRRAYQ